MNDTIVRASEHHIRNKKKGKKGNEPKREERPKTGPRWLATRTNPPKKRRAKIKRVTKSVDENTRAKTTAKRDQEVLAHYRHRGKRPKNPGDHTQKSRTWPKKGMGDTTPKRAKPGPKMGWVTHAKKTSPRPGTPGPRLEGNKAKKPFG